MVIPRRSTLKRLYFRILHLLRQDERLLRGLGRQSAVAVLNLHEISPVDKAFGPPLHPVEFEELLVYVTKHFHVTTFHRAATPTDDKRPRVILSFDDGYQSFVEHAMPLLHAHGVAVNQNVIGESVKTGRPPWNTRLNDFLNAAPRSLINELRLPGFSMRLGSETPDEKAQYGVALSRFLKLRPRGAREPLWNRVEELMDRGGFVSSTRMMSVDDVRFAATEHEIGAHSFSHESMAFESDEYFLEDFARCEAFFRDELGLPLDIYAFPNGVYRQEQVEMLQRRGIRYVLLVEEKLATGLGGVFSRLTLSAQFGLEAKFQAVGYKARGVLLSVASAAFRAAFADHSFEGVDLIARRDGLVVQGGDRVDRRR